MVLAHSNPTERGNPMNFSRRSRIEDALFVIALLVPAMVGGARYLQSDREMTLIARAHAPATSVAASAPAPALHG
jgi:hypothetical protein